MKVLLVPSVNPQAAERARLLSARLAVAGIDAAIQPSELNDAPVVPVEDLLLVVSIGGDGTLLGAARLISFAPVPILGLNYGTLGFLTGNPERDELELITDALAGDLAVERRSTLDAVITDHRGEVVNVTALNEIAYTRGASGHVVEYSYGVNGITIATLKADGLVVATATGSTAYALSAGGPIVSPGYPGLVAVPLAPHALGSRALVMAPSDVLETKMFGRSMLEASVFVDGIALDIEGAVSLEVKRGENEVHLVRGGSDFFTSVSKVFYGGGL